MVLQVNSNGLLSFLTEIPNFFSIQFPLNYPVIAPLYANVDTSARGQIFYRQSQDPALLQRFNDRVTRFYPRLRQPFSASNLFIASWLEVGYYPQGTDKVCDYVLSVVRRPDGLASSNGVFFAERYIYNGLVFLELTTRICCL